MCSPWELNSLRGGGPPVSWRGFGGVWLPSIQGILSASLLPSFVFLPLPSPLRNSLPSPSIALSSLLLHGRPKVLVLDLRWSGFTDPLPANPIPNALALGKGSRFRSSLLASTQHDLRDKVDNGRRRLVGVKLCEEVASVVCGAALLPGHEAKEPMGVGEDAYVRNLALEGKPSGKHASGQPVFSNPAPLQTSRTGASSLKPSPGDSALLCFMAGDIPLGSRGGRWV